MATDEDVAALVERLCAAEGDDHERGCQGREYACTCGYDAGLYKAIGEAAATITRLAEERADAVRLSKLTWEERQAWKAKAEAAEQALAALRGDDTVTDIVDLHAERNKREAPDTDCQRKDEFGRPLYLFAFHWFRDGHQYGNTLWAYSAEDAQAHIEAMRGSLAYDGQIFGMVPA